MSGLTISEQLADQGLVHYRASGGSYAHVITHLASGEVVGIMTANEAVAFLYVLTGEADPDAERAERLASHTGQWVERVRALRANGGEA